MEGDDDDQSGRLAVPAKDLGRLDLVIETTSFDEATGVARVRVIPDPRRYDQVEIDGELHYVDRYLGHAIPTSLLADVIHDLPLYHLAPRINSTETYANERTSAVREALAGQQLREPTTLPAPQEELAEQTVRLPFLSLDICASTTLRRAAPAAFDKAAQLVLDELLLLVGQFNGSVYKETGDGFIAFLNHPSYNRQCDNAVDLGLSLIKTVKALNSALIEAALPQISIRVGADYGVATFAARKRLLTGFTYRPVTSDALNRAVKIEQSARENTLRIGADLHRLLHVQWLARATNIPDSELPSALSGYAVYEVV